MVEANKYGKITLSMKDTGQMTKPTAEADSYMETEMSMKENGKTTKLMAKEYTPKMMDPVTQVSGLKIFSMDSESRNGQMDLLTRGISFFIKHAL
jgi:hypothetical protein